MKKLAALLFVLGLAVPAFADADTPRVLVVDPDRAGTNVRDAPSGSVIDVIPYASPGSPDSVKERRVVRLLANEGKWFKVAYDGGEGYVSFWNSGDGYFVKNETEFRQYLNNQTMGGLQL